MTKRKQISESQLFYRIHYLVKAVIGLSYSSQNLSKELQTLYELFSFQIVTNLAMMERLVPSRAIVVFINWFEKTLDLETSDEITVENLYQYALPFKVEIMKQDYAWQYQEIQNKKV